MSEWKYSVPASHEHVFANLWAFERELLCGERYAVWVRLDRKPKHYGLLKHTDGSAAYCLTDSELRPLLLAEFTSEDDIETVARLL